MNRSNSQTSMSTEPLRSRTLANAAPNSSRLAIEGDPGREARKTIAAVVRTRGCSVRMFLD
jgi:hypothetical protein